MKKLLPLFCLLGLAAQPAYAANISNLQALGQADFRAIWATLDESHRDFWQRRFEAGHDEVANLERRKLVAALTSNDSNRADFNAARAA